MAILPQRLTLCPQLFQFIRLSVRLRVGHTLSSGRLLWLSSRAPLMVLVRLHGTQPYIWNPDASSHKLIGMIQSHACAISYCFRGFVLAQRLNFFRPPCARRVSFHTPRLYKVSTQLCWTGHAPRAVCVTRTTAYKSSAHSREEHSCLQLESQSTCSHETWSVDLQGCQVWNPADPVHDIGTR